MALQSFFYDQQIRRYLIQFIRMVSNFQVEFGKDRNGATALQRVPVVYGDSSRQVAYIIKQGSENYLNSVPVMAVYVAGLGYDRERVQNPTYVGKLNLRERWYDSSTGEYSTQQGDTLTVERLMPVPYKLTLKLDVWTSNTEQKLQLIEQIATLFNPALEIQSTDNYIDWTSITYVLLTDLQWTSRSVPAGIDTNQIDIATLTFELPIYISAPALVKKMGVIQNIVASIFSANGSISESIYTDSNLLSTQYITPLNYGIILLGNTVRLVKYNQPTLEPFGENIIKEITGNVNGNVGFYVDDTIGIKPGMEIVGLAVTGPGTITANTNSIIVTGNSTSFTSNLGPGIILYHNNSELGMVDTVVSNTQLYLTDNTLSNVTAAGYTYIQGVNEGNCVVISTNGDRVVASNLVTATIGDKIVFNAITRKYGVDEPWRDIVNIYGNLTNGVSQIRVELPDSTEVIGTVAYSPTDDTVLLWNPDVDTIPVNTLAPINAIIDPTTSRPNKDLQSLQNGTRYLLINDYNSTDTGANAAAYNWLGVDNTPLIAYANDIIQYTGQHWVVDFVSNSSPSTEYVTNMITNTQYRWDGAAWSKTFEGYYPAGKWQLVI